MGTHLNPGLCELYPHGELFSHEDVGVVGLGEGSFELVELRRSEASAVPFRLGVLIAGQVTAAQPSAAVCLPMKKQTGQVTAAQPSATVTLPTNKQKDR